MDKQTTEQVARALGITKAKLHQTLYLYQALRPAERVGKQKQYLYLWAEAEIAALRAHLSLHPLKPRIKPSD